MAEDAKLAAPELNEIATSGDGRDVTRPYFGPLANPQDSVLGSIGQRWAAYRELRRDGQVHATFQQRRLAIVGRPLVVEPGREDAISQAAAAQLQANLDAIAYDRATKLMSWGFFYGFSVGECMWAIRDNKVWLDQVKVRTPWRFRFTPEGELRLLTLRNAFKGEELPDRKFWVMSDGADNDDEPYGLGLAHQLYWPVYFKKQGLAFWLRALEKFGAPTAVGTYPAGTSLADQDKLLRAVQAIRVDGAVIKPNGTIIDLLEANRGTVDQATFLRQMNAEISKITIAQTMTTDDGASLAQGKVHENVKEEVTDADVENLCESFQQGPARWLTEWNFPGAAVPILKRPSPEDEERAAELRKKMADTIKTMGDAGYEPDETTLGDMFPGWRPKAPATPPAAVAPASNVVALRPAFAETASTDAIDDFVEGLEWEPLIGPIADVVENLVRNAPTLEAAADQLVTLFTGPAAATLADQVARALFEARLAGEGGAAVTDVEALAEAAGG